MIEYKTLTYIVIGLLGLYLAFRIAEQRLINKIVRAELEHVIKSNEHKVKGRFQ